METSVKEGGEKEINQHALESRLNRTGTPSLPSIARPRLAVSHALHPRPHACHPINSSDSTTERKRNPQEGRGGAPVKLGWAPAEAVVGMGIESVDMPPLNEARGGAVGVAACCRLITFW
jgi:hypothetical protein